MTTSPGAGNPPGCSVQRLEAYSAPENPHVENHLPSSVVYVTRCPTARSEGEIILDTWGDFSDQESFKGNYGHDDIGETMAAESASSVFG
jgi:hypothetical protein